MMNIGEFPKEGQHWFRDVGPQGDVVVSSRIRLARNIAGRTFVTCMDRGQQNEVLDLCQSEINQIDCKPEKPLWINLEELERVDRQVLAERHLISWQHANSERQRGVAVHPHEAYSIMVNEEDHLRMQVMCGGFQLDEAYRMASILDRQLEERMQFAFTEKRGYLTACPTNVGTGLRVSVMLHLPAMKLTGEIDKLRRAANDMHLAVRGFYGEGSETLGGFYQLSNQTTLGKSEEEILNDFQQTIIPQVISYEREARTALDDRRQSVLDDRIFRAWGVLTHSRMLGHEEAMNLLSFVRLGVHMGKIDMIDISVVNELTLLIQPAHLQKLTRQVLKGSLRREARAQLVRSRLQSCS